MANAITQDKIIEINEAYLVIKTYAGVARKVGVCAGTVKKYIIDGYVSQINLKVEKKDIEIPPLNAAFLSPRRIWEFYAYFQMKKKVR